MRLIDADKINFEEIFKGQYDFAIDTRDAAKSLIDMQPTAYDIDQVVDQIKGIMQDESIRFVDQAVRAAIKIVKGGGTIE